jgi:hypothetical protein
MMFGLVRCRDGALAERNSVALGLRRIEAGRMEAGHPGFRVVGLCRWVIPGNFPGVPFAVETGRSFVEWRSPARQVARIPDDLRGAEPPFI